MSLVVEQEGDIELADLQHIQHSRLSQELRADRDTPSDAGQLTRHDDDHCPSSQAGLSTTQPADYDDPTSRSWHNIEPLRLEDLQVPSPVHHRAPHHSPAYPISNNPNTTTPRRLETPTQSFGIAPNPLSHSFDSQPQFLSGQVAPHTGKGKGRIPSTEQQPRVEETVHPENLLQRRRLPPSLLANFFEIDAQRERGQDHQKKFQRLQNEARYVCTAVRRDKCRIHGRLFQQRSAQDQGSEDSEAGQTSTYGFVNGMPEPDESAKGACGTVYDLSGLAEEAGQAAEDKRERDLSPHNWWEWLMFLFVGTLGVVAVALSVKEHT
jgi:hypothetical protein